MVTVKKIIKYTIPFYGNKHLTPYGELLVSDGKSEKVVKFENDIFCFDSVKYSIENKGCLYNPKFEITPH